VNQKDEDGSHALIHAARLGRLEAVQALLVKQDCDLNLESKEGWSALTWASWAGYIKVVIVLLAESKIEVNLRDECGTTPIILAAMEGHSEVVVELAEFGGIDINLQATDGTTVLMVAAAENDVKAIGAIVQVPDVNCNLTKKDGVTALMIAAEKGNQRVVRSLSRCPSMDVNAAREDGMTALMLAADNDQPEALLYLLTWYFNIDVNMANEDKMTALMIASMRDFHKAVSTLLDGRADTTLKTKDGRSALVFAAQNSRESVIAFLKRSDEIFNESDVAEDLFTGFMLAAHSGPQKAFDTFLTFEGLQVEAEDEAGDNALLRAVSGGQLEIATTLLDKKIADFDLRHRNKAGQSALRLSVVSGNYFVTKLLLDKGALVERDIDNHDHQGRHLAVWMGVEFSEMRLVDPFVQSAKTWTSFWECPADCKDDMKDKCTGSLMTRAQSASVVHALLDWQYRIDEGDDKSSDEKRKRYEIGLLQKSKEAIMLALTTALGEGKPQPEAAMALLSRGAWEADKDEHWIGQLNLHQIRLPSHDRTSKVSMFETRAWNRLHWGAFSCDSSALSLALKFPLKDLVDLLDSTPLKGNRSTPFQIARNNQKCIRTYAILEDLQETWKRQFFYRSTSGYFTSFACSGALGLQLFFLQMQTLKNRGCLFMSLIPTSYLVTGLLLILIETDGTRGSVTANAIQQNVGYATMSGGGLLLLGVVALFASTRFAECLSHTKRKGNHKLDRCWEKVNCALAWLLVITLVVEAGLLQQMDIGFERVAIIAGFAHAGAASVRFFIAAPKKILLPLRLAPGVLLLAWVIYDGVHSHSGGSRHEMPSTEALVLVATCLALALADMAGAVKKAVKQVKSRVEIELVSKQATNTDEKFAANKLILGRAAASAHGIETTLGLTPAQIAQGLVDPIKAMRAEILAAGDQNDLENFNYIVEGVSGRPSDLPSAVSTSLLTGIYHGGTLEPDDFDTGHDGKTLADWMAEEEVVLARLTEAEFVAVRFYTSSSFSKINRPLRQEVRPHPWAMVVYLLDRGIKKLRAVQAQVNPQAFAGETTLWRGMKNLAVDVKEFAEFGGTEMAPMSTTTNEEVARHYAASKAPLVFKYVVGGLKTGVSIQFLSLYPKEKEYLYAPLTFLSLKNHYEDDGTTILVVEPVMS